MIIYYMNYRHIYVAALILAVGTLLPTAASAQQVQEGDVVLQEVPLALEAPGFYRYVNAYHDGETFYVDIVRLFRLLGFEVRHVPPLVEALDAARTYTINFAEGTARRTASPTTEISLAGEYVAGAGRYYVTIAGLSALFEADIYFEEERLSLRLSTAADKFNVGALRSHPRLQSQAPGPLRFGRTRSLLGGVIASYQVSRHQTGDQPGLYQGSLSFTGSLLGGSLGGDIQMLRRQGVRRQTDVSVSTLSYLFDQPGSRLLTRFEVGRFRQPYWSTPEPFEALRFSNLPLSSRYLQRESIFSGLAEPHALVEAVVSGVVVDRAEADEEGRYQVRVPTYYGSTEAVVRTRPLGGASAREERHFLFATSKLIEPGRLYYDAYLGRTQQAHRPVGLARFQYGLLPTLSARTAGIYYGDRALARIGAAFSPISFGVVSADVDLPSVRSRVDLKMWHSRMSVEATYEHAPKPSIFQANRHLFQSQVTASWRRLSGFVDVSFTEGFQGWSLARISPTLSYFGKTGFTASAQLTAQRLATSSTSVDGYTYRASFGKTFFLPGGSSRLSLFTRGSERRTVQQSGLEGFFSWKTVSLGFSAGYHFLAEDFTGALTLRLDAPFSGFSSRGAYSGAAFTHEESLYGSIELSPRPRLTRGALQESSAVIRIFEDLSGDGHYQPDEPLRPEVKVQLYQAGLTRQPDGTLRASFLQPFTEYQVQVLERSIRDPLLTPLAGYTFSFIADPGRTKRIDIPLQRMPVVTGYVRGMEIAPSRLRLLVSRGEEQVETADLYRDGGFTLRLPPGRYELSLVDVLGERSFASARQSVFVQPGSGEPLHIELSLAPAGARHPEEESPQGESTRQDR